MINLTDMQRTHLCKTSKMCLFSVEKTKIRQSLLFVTQSQPQQPTATTTTATTFTKEVKKRKKLKEEQQQQKKESPKTSTWPWNFFWIKKKAKMAEQLQIPTKRYDQQKVCFTFWNLNFGDNHIIATKKSKIRHHKFQIL